jgi:alkyl sulfatase BDS1-like metallo-beta-lactamase superfamily hydrolase
VSGTAGIKKMRVAAQAGHALPAEGADADSAGTVVSKAGEHGYVAPTRPVERNGQELTIRGVRFVFYTEYPFDTDCTLLLWLPEEKTVIHNHLTGNFPNVYSIGGGPFRDPRPWIAGLDKIRALAPEQLLGCHGLPFAGRAHVTEVVTVTRDALQFVYDQTVRAMNRGLSPREAVDLVKLPESLADHPALSQTYGEVWHHVRSVYEGLIGWYDGDAANLVPLDPALESLRIVEGFGGPQAALDNARQALARGETGWATRLASHVRRTTASGEYVREAALLEAAALRRAAWITPAWGTRNACLTQARELEGHPGRESLQQAPTLSMLMESPPSATIGFLRSRLVPERVDAGEHYLVLILSDASYNLILRNGVLDATHRPTADTTGSAGDSAEPRELRIDRSDLLHYLLNGVGGDKLPPYARRFFDHFELPWTTADPAERLPWKRQPNSRS